LQNDNFEELTLTLNTKANKTILLEPISIVISLENKTSYPITGHSALKFSKRRIGLIVSYKGVTQKIKDLSPLRPFTLIAPKIINPGDKYSVTENLDINLSENFPEAASYEIQAIFYDIKEQKQITSNKMIIEIEQPKGLDLEAFKHIQSTMNSSLSSAIGNSNEEEILREFIKKYKGSTYEKYASYMLAEFYFVRHNYVEVIACLKPIIPQKSFTSFEGVLSYMTQSYIKVGQKEEAKRYMNILESDYPTSEELDKCRNEMASSK